MSNRAHCTVAQCWIDNQLIQGFCYDYHIYSPNFTITHIFFHDPITRKTYLAAQLIDGQNTQAQVVQVPSQTLPLEVVFAFES